MTALLAQKSGPLTGSVSVPGDKSISHRALIVGALAIGTTRISGLLEGEDVLRTAAALRALGVEVRHLGPGSWEVGGVGVGGLAAPDDVLDMGNAGTGARLMIGTLATHDLTAHVTGDASLRSRPMGRIAVPLRRMGADIEAREGDRLPLTVRGTTAAIPIEYELPVASAQVKSAVLLAALNTPGTTTLIEPERCRDHTELMLAAAGAELRVEDRDAGGRRISLAGEQELHALDIDVPGDPSSAAFPGTAAILVPGSEVTIGNVGMNPLRTGLFATLREMGADITETNNRDAAGEPVADLTFRHSALQGVDVPAERAPSMIDEYPVLAVAAAFATGETRMHGLGELRVKESDRLQGILDGLAACGVDARAEGDTLIVSGGAGRVAGGGTVASKLDHRMAMAFLVAGMASDSAVTVDDGSPIATSFPGFVEMMSGLGGSVSVVDD